MDEPPPRRARRPDGAATRDNDKADSRPNPGGRDKNRSQYGDDREDDRRKRSRSRDHYERRRERSRSRDKYRERDRDRGRGDRGRDTNGGIRRERSQSRDRNRGPRDYRNERSYRRSRSRSPFKSGATTSARTRSPPRRPDHDRARSREKTRAAVDGSRPNAKADATHRETPLANGDRMAIDEDDEEQLMKRLMGFTTFKTTQNTKVPGNQIYGVRTEKKTEYRQYMNRVGGFNRPLSPSR